MRETITTLAELFGLGLVAAGCWMVTPALGLIAGGASLVAIGVTQAPTTKDDQ